MSGLGKPKRAKMPPATAPAATPVQLDEQVLEKDRARRRQRLRTAGRQGTILTQGGLGGRLEPDGATLLGGVG